MSGVVDQGIDQVWSFLSDPATAPRWDRSIAEVIPHSTGAPGVGWEATTVSPDGKRQRFRISHYRPPTGFAFVLLESSMFRYAELRFQLEPMTPGTRITHTIDLRLRNPLLKPILRAVSRRALARDFEALTAALRD
ncbi:SRPBCC family protein [Amycolatopsis jiangsuensis]|uniref:Polyketide cyclase/dehydrase/lipid transport protein n=1 Tax=Amycolatopsis jiangsuensis TaxID=1181879 RepID=A0A840IWR5_9PSEU|nr:SRPBCC family protein [Amycolatopsis jiangsuensis]MBB4685875.1 hypothetical protein [Amycolatopsis jiangsuensis]